MNVEATERRGILTIFPRKAAEFHKLTRGVCKTVGPSNFWPAPHHAGNDAKQRHSYRGPL